MKILVWGINYSPELTGIAPYNVALCNFLKANGHEVRMLTTFAYYPAWKKLPTEGKLIYRQDDIDGIPVYRCWHYVPARANAAKRILHEASFVTMSFLRLLFLPAPDVCVVVSPPLLLGLAAWIASKIKGFRYLFHVQDLQPDAAAGLGMLKPGLLLSTLYRLERLAYRHAVRVSGISQGMMSSFTAKGVPSEKLLYFPNGVELGRPEEWPARGRFRDRHGFSPDDFLAIYSGNFGVKQGLEVLPEAARELKDSRIKLLIFGDGASKPILEERLRRYALKNVFLFPLQPELFYREMLVDADVCLITQQAGSGRAFFPSKLLASLSFAKPILSVADHESELAHALSEGRFGVNVLPNRPVELARALEGLAADPAQRRQLGLNGLEWVNQFETSRVLGNFEAALRVLFTNVKYGKSRDEGRKSTAENL